MTLKIAIIGAGPGGCMLARLLQQSKVEISATIFESEGGIDFRSQGGSLDLHVKTGQAALKAGGLFEEFLKDARYDGEAMTMCDKNLLIYIKQSGTEGKSQTGRPEIDRPKLRELLYNGLAKDTVRWNHKLVAVDEDLTLHFANGNAETGFDLVVGADGAWSKVRPRLSTTQPFYSGVAGHSFRIVDAQRTEPELYSLANRGSIFSWSDGRTIMGQYMGDGSLNIATWAVRPENWRNDYDVHDATAVKAAARKDYADWDLRLVAFVQKADDHVVPRDLYMLPIGHKWDHVKGVTLIGDAAHLMTPFAGEGVNLALEDSLMLSKAIIAAAGDASALDKNVLDFERDMFKRATETQQLTYDMMTSMLFTPGSPRVGIEKYICRAVEGEMGPWVTKLVLAPIIYTYFFFFKLIW